MDAPKTFSNARDVMIYRSVSLEVEENTLLIQSHIIFLIIHTECFPSGMDYWRIEAKSRIQNRHTGG
jgi:hypothetical protein